MTYREALTIIAVLLVVLFVSRLALMMLVPAPRARKVRSSAQQPALMAMPDPVADPVIRNVEVITDEDLSRPRMNYLWHVLPDNPALHELAADRLERGWMYSTEQQVGVRGNRYVVDGVPSIKPRKGSI